MASAFSAAYDDEVPSIPYYFAGISALSYLYSGYVCSWSSFTFSFFFFFFLSSASTEEISALESHDERHFLF